MEDRALAFIIDGEVVSVMRFDERTASIILSSPTIIDISPVAINQGWNYDPEKGFYTTIDGSEVIATPGDIEI